jgi:Ran GTPase-activating protein (RanGAP) involved in mRNA processing and transport
MARHCRMRHLGMRYDRSLFGMRLTDVESLSRCIRTTPTLVRLSLPCNMIDDNMLMVLMAGLLDNRTITHLDLSHNSITSAGLQLLIKLLKPPCILHALNLADNKIDEKAGKHIAKALRSNETLTDLNLRLNDLGDEGGRSVLDALAVNTAVTILNLSSNRCVPSATCGPVIATCVHFACCRLGTASAATAATLLANPACNLCVLDLTGNRLDESDAEILHKAVTNNHTITTLDLRGNAGITERR